MAEDKLVFSDHAYKVMTEIAENEEVTQRELSRSLGISVGSINILLNKLVREGFIKIEQVSGKQMLYMLTPTGMVEKAKKTASYLKAHYHAIYTTKEKIKNRLGKLLEDYDAIYVLLKQDEISEILKVAVEEYTNQNKMAKIYLIRKHQKITDKVYDLGVIVHMGIDSETVQIYERYLDMGSADLVNYL